MKSFYGFLHHFGVIISSKKEKNWYNIATSWKEERDIKESVERNE